MEGRIKIIGRSPTPEQVQGPFYPVVKPSDQDADLTEIKGKPGKAEGQIIYLAGQVTNTEGEPLSDIQIEIWQANTFGRYIHPNDSNPAPLDPHFQGYGVRMTNLEGRYEFKTVKPGAYAVDRDWKRPPHIHFMLTSKSSKLITQMYFPGEPLNEKDYLFKNTVNSELLLTRLSPSTGEMEPKALIASWDIVLV